MVSARGIAGWQILDNTPQTKHDRIATAAICFDITLWNAVMAYIVQAIALDGKSGKITAEATTKRAAMKSAQHFGKQGLATTIAEPDGKPVDEADGDPANPRWRRRGGS